MAKPKYSKPVKLRSMKTAPKDGTPVLLYPDGLYWPFIGYWGCVTRYRTDNKGWLGHEWGVHRDSDLLGWYPIPVRGAA